MLNPLMSAFLLVLRKFSWSIVVTISNYLIVPYCRVNSGMLNIIRLVVIILTN